MKFFNCTIAAAILALMANGPAFATSATTEDFSSGPHGWVGNALVDDSLGNGAPAFHSVVENYGLSWRNDGDAAFLGNYTQFGTVTLGIDVLTQSILYEGTEVSRDLIVSLVDHGDPANGIPDAVVWYNLGSISAGSADWKHFSVVFGTGGDALPGGWGADDGEGDLVLPPGRTFSSVLANVDEITFTTYTPGYFYGFADFDVAADNITLSTSAVPEPSMALAMVLGLGLLAARRRRAPR
jgi:hypothetical protein